MPTNDAGTVVQIIALICENIFTLVTNAAKFVVSESGDILSPKTAPAMIAPATIPSLKPRFVPIAIKAIPAVDAEPHAVPVATEVNAQMINADTKKILGFRNCNP